MLKPTVMNIEKMGESYLNQALDHFQDDFVTVVLIEMRLNQLASERTAQFKRAQEAEIRKMMELSIVQEEIKAFLESFSGSRMILLINALEPSYVEDYIICNETFSVSSNVSLENQNSYWECSSFKEAQSKVISLAYDRVYGKYVRRGTVETLDYVKQKLVA